VVVVEVGLVPVEAGVGDVVVLGEDDQVVEVDVAIAVCIAAEEIKVVGEVVAAGAVEVAVERIAGGVGDAGGVQREPVVAVGEDSGDERGRDVGGEVVGGVVDRDQRAGGQVSERDVGRAEGGVDVLAEGERDAVVGAERDVEVGGGDRGGDLVGDGCDG
jgi:hypothetical protein